ncbi:hypothetical protein [Paraburkholderia youngii]|uniref:hypothetical protein n=1 Tax=Paraburkholderia youngii TaxID=2782701 RepID=UPI003D1D96B7
MADVTTVGVAKVAISQESNTGLAVWHTAVGFAITGFEALKMRTVYEDQKLREALHSIYVAQFKAIQACPHAFGKGDATRMLTGLMGSRPWSWRVIGITPAALKVFAGNDFKRPARQLQRGHKYDRSLTAQALYFDRSEPAPLNEFFDFFLERDATVIMTNDENRHGPKNAFPSYIPIEPDLELFPCGTLVGWQHRKAEIAYLRDLYAQQEATRNTSSLGR